MPGARDPLGWQAAAIGAVFALAGAAIVEGLVLVGLHPLGPVGWPSLGAIVAAGIYGWRGLLGAVSVVAAYYLVNAAQPERFPAFFAGPALGLAWLSGIAIVCTLLIAMRARLLQAIQAEAREPALKENQDRFRHLAEMSSDWYWEQDEHFRFTFVSSAAHDHALSPAQLIGKTRWDFQAQNLSEEDWQRHRAQLERREPFRDLVAERRDATGRRRWSSVSGEPMVDRAGRFLGYRGLGRDVTAQREADEARRESDARLRLLAESLPALVGYVDREERFRFCNNAYQEWFGMPAGQLTGRTVREVWGEERYRVIAPNNARALAGEKLAFDYNFLDQHGRERQVLAQYVPHRDESGKVVGFFVLGTDVTEMARARRDLQQAHERLEHALSGSSAAMWDADLRTGRVYLSETWARLLGAAPGETYTTTEALTTVIAHPEDLPAIREASIRAMKGPGDYAVEHRVRTASGAWRWILSRGRVTERDPASGRALRMIGTNLDISDRKESEEKLKSATQRDPLTGLANRTLLADRICLAMARAARTGSGAALLYVDIDRFKAVNDDLGHAAGDAVLREMASRLRSCVRQTDTVARIGGDELVVLLEDLKDPGDAPRVAAKILEQARAPIPLEGGALTVTLSIGLAHAAQDESDTAWLARADAALYGAKRAGRNGLHVAD